MAYTQRDVIRGTRTSERKPPPHDDVSAATQPKPAQLVGQGPVPTKRAVETPPPGVHVFSVTFPPSCTSGPRSIPIAALGMLSVGTSIWLHVPKTGAVHPAPGASRLDAMEPTGP